MTSRQRRSNNQFKNAPLDLALQGGGSHGAFTWGVLDRLLQDDTLAIDGVSGTSAGALNAAVMATGWADGGRESARRALRAFWLDLAGQGGCFGNPAVTWPHGQASNPWVAWAALGGLHMDQNPWQAWTQQFLRAFSPYQFNPFDINPLRQVVARHVHVPALRKGPLSLFVTATAVRSGQPRVFHRDDLSVDALLASSCLPQLFRAVEIDGQPYWDGGYSGNPSIWPLIYETAALDVMLVKINPLLRPDLPDTSEEIADRINEITFNAGLMAEMRAIGFVQRLVQQGRLGQGQYKNLRLHMIADEEQLAQLHPSSKLNTERGFIEHLHGLGLGAAERWLDQHRADIGQRSTLDPAATFLAPRGVA
ncbi:MAG: patatin-like phospholipase family protein [Rubrivivax sp.]|nr:patatin-like phospholipase family protein [Rubrivivax sp.]MBK7261297.1 patatin-like phospholipase family protein [Rubrivivax sp.]